MEVGAIDLDTWLSTQHDEMELSWYTKGFSSGVFWKLCKVRMGFVQRQISEKSSQQLKVRWIQRNHTWKNKRATNTATKLIWIE